MDLTVSGYGFVDAIKSSAGIAKFTLKSGKNRYFVTVAGAEQCAIVTTAHHNNSELFLVGRLYSFIHNGCAQHHCGIDAIIVLHSDGARFSSVEQQLILNQHKNGNHNGKITNLA